ncbi:XRE family transcriptional regulator [Micromonospora fluostatini]|uniref:XRE family transcriptional regulator n=2 Tax=Micromonospora TaxID=1873 RepID=A0ABY2DLK1_9ACTN|nr:XRE family transcriptional regulator [Micromonospora fluostatini]
MRTAKTTLREYTAGELRARLARERISVTALARRLGWSQSYLARRVDGRVAFDLDDLEKVADELGIHVADLLPTPSTANTLPNPVSAKKARSAATSPKRSTRATHRPPSRPGGTTPRADTRRPAMISRPLPA